MEVEARTLPSTRVGDSAKLLAALEQLESLPVVNGQARFKEAHNHFSFILGDLSAPIAFLQVSY